MSHAARIWTSTLRYAGPDRLDITRKGEDPLGQHFAPTWKLLGPFLAKRKAEGLSDSDWAAYSAAYTEEMRTSYRAHRFEWETLLAMPEVTICCFCPTRKRCHRDILAGILTKLGAQDLGERGEERTSALYPTYKSRFEDA